MFSILFKRFRNDTTKQGTIAFVHIGKPVTRDDAIRWIHEKGFRPATMDDAEPERDKMIRSASKSPIVFLGTVHIKKGVPCSPCLHQNGSAFGNRFDENCRFAVMSSSEANASAEVDHPR